MTKEELDNEHRGMADRVRNGKPWNHDDFTNDTYEILTIVKKEICRGKVTYLVEQKSPVDCTEPCFWTEEKNLNASEIVKHTKFRNKEVTRFGTLFSESWCDKSKFTLGSIMYGLKISDMFTDKDCLNYTLVMATRVIPNARETEIEDLRLFMNVSTVRGAANRLSRAVEVAADLLNIKMQRQPKHQRNLAFVQSGQNGILNSPTFICKVSPTPQEPAAHTVLVHENQVYDLTPRYSDIRECTDKVWDVYNLAPFKRGGPRKPLTQFVQTSLNKLLCTLMESQLAPMSMTQQFDLQTLFSCCQRNTSSDWKCHQFTTKLCLTVCHMLRRSTAVTKYSTLFWQTIPKKASQFFYSDRKSGGKELNEMLLGDILTSAVNSDISVQNEHKWKLEKASESGFLHGYWGTGAKGVKRWSPETVDVVGICLAFIEFLPFVGTKAEERQYNEYLKQIKLLKQKKIMGQYLVGHDTRSSCMAMSQIGLCSPPRNDFVYLSKKKLQKWFTAQSIEDQLFMDTIYGRNCRGFVSCMLMNCPPPNDIVEANRKIQLMFRVQPDEKVFYLMARDAIKLLQRQA